jgi:hypothetical protein
MSARWYGMLKLKSFSIYAHVWGAVVVLAYMWGWPGPYIYWYIRCIHTVFSAGISQYIRSYTVQIYGSGQPYIYAHFWGAVVLAYMHTFGVL